MKSRVSCCNGALLQRDLTRSALIWGAYLLLWLVFLPGSILSNADWQKAIAVRECILSAAQSCHAVSFFYGAAVAWLLFSYLNKSRSANFFGALPLRRETQFLTHYLAGLLCALLPNFLVMGVTILTGAGQEINLVVESGIWFAAQSLTFVFYYSFAVLCAMLVGQMVAMPILYGILNLTAVVVEAVIRDLIPALIYGMGNRGELLFSWLSPIYYFLFENTSPTYKGIWENETLKGFEFMGWRELLILAAVGLVFAALAFWCYRRRRMEAAGDVMAVRHLRPVFRWCFTFGCTLVIGVLLTYVLIDSMSSSYFYGIGGCLLAATVLGSILSEMILSKSMRVFRKKTYCNILLSCAIVTVVLVCCRIDVLGVSRYIPQTAEIQGVILENAHRSVDDPAIIEQVRTLHQEILAQQTQTEQACRQDDWPITVDITYIRKNGSSVTRRYSLPVNMETATDEQSLIRRYEAIANQPAMILAREVPEGLNEQNIDNCNIYYELPDGDSYYTSSMDPTAEQTMELWNTAILPDLRDGNMGQVRYTEAYCNQESDYLGISVEISLVKDSRETPKIPSTVRAYYYYQIPGTAVRTIAALKELGVPAEAFERH